MDEEEIKQGLIRVRERMALAAGQAGRKPDDITLLAVSKTFPAEAVVMAAASGQRHFGENYVREAVAKIAGVEEQLGRAAAHGLVWHFIGPIQSNKTREIAAHFDWVHGVEREKIARRLSEQRPPALPPLNICIQVNVSGEASKSGVAPEEAEQLASLIAGLGGVKLRGLMCIPEAEGDPRSSFRTMRELLGQLNASGYELDTLSMGMSGDFELAIAEGATIVRVGSAIFGKRNYAK